MEINKEKIKKILGITLFAVIVITLCVFTYDYYLKVSKYYARGDRGPSIYALCMIGDDALYVMNMEDEPFRLHKNPMGAGIIVALDMKYFQAIPVEIPPKHGVKIPLSSFFTRDLKIIRAEYPNQIRLVIKGRDCTYRRGVEFDCPGHEENRKRMLKVFKKMEERGYIYVVDDRPERPSILI